MEGSSTSQNYFNHYDKGFRDNNGQLSNLCSRFGRTNQRILGSRTRSFRNTQISPFSLRTEERGAIKQDELIERRNRQFEEEKRHRNFIAREFTSKEAQKFDRPAPKTTQCQEMNLSIERRLEESRAYHNGVKLRNEQKEREKEIEEERKREIEQQQTGTKIIIIFKL